MITDLDSFTESDDEEEQEVTVNPALLKRIRNNSLRSPNTSPAPTVTSQALILFKPLPRLVDPPEVTEAPEEADDDAMDVEP